MGGIQALYSPADMTGRTGIVYEGSHFSEIPWGGGAQGERCSSPGDEPENRPLYLAGFATKIHAPQKAQETKSHFQCEVMALASSMWLVLRSDLSEAVEVGMESVIEHRTES